MNEFLRDFHFIYPHWLWLLPVLLLLAFWIQRKTASSERWQQFIDERLRPFVVTGQGVGKRWIGLWLALAAILATLSLAGPSWEKKELPAFQTRQGLAVAFDLSSSMLASDVAPNRLQMARFKLMDLLNARKEGQTALVVFAGDAFAVSPLTDDVRNIVEQIRNLEPSVMPAQGSLVERGLHEAHALLEQAGYKRGDILLITDGMSDGERAMSLSAELFEKGYRVSVAGIGTEAGGRIPAALGGWLRKRNGELVKAGLDQTALKGLAEVGGGIYRQLQIGDAGIDAFAELFAQRYAPVVKSREKQVEYWENAGIWLLLLLVPLCLALFRRGYVFSLLGACVVLHLLPQQAQAFDWNTLWLNKDQQAQRALENKDAKTAKQLFERQDWKAAAAYRDKDYETAADLYSADSDAQSLYNRATALAKAGDTKRAIQTYDEALKLQPHHADAKFNRDLLKKQEEEKKKQQQQQQNKDQKDQQKNQQDQQNQQQNKEQQQNQQQDKKDSQQSDQKKADKQSEKKDPQKGKEEKKSANEEGKEEKKSQRAGKQQKSDKEKKEQAQRTKQWLRKIPDDSAGLWRRKFRYQYRERNGQRAPSGENW